MIQTLLTIIKTARLDLSDEKRTQNDVSQLLSERQIPHEREVRLTPADIVDFLVENIAVEIKLKGQRKKDIYRQLCRYAKSDRVKHIVLATNITMGLPEYIDGKPVYFIALGRAWL
jgi:hypothetical protein